MALDDILADVDATLEVAVEIDSVLRSDGTAKTWYFSTFQRSNGSGDTPANTEFLPYLLPPWGKLGPLTQSLTEDTLFAGLAQADAGTLVLVQRVVDTDQLSTLLDYTFAGRQVRVKIGRRTDDYDNFATLRTLTCDVEPEVVLTGQGLQATFFLASALERMLNEPLLVDRYVGIPHCLKLLTATGVVNITRIAAYDVSRFTVSVRFRMASPPAAIRGLWRKYNSATDNHFLLRVTTAGKVEIAATSAGAGDISFTSTDVYADGEWHVAAFARDNATTAYLLVDGEVLQTFAPAGAPDLSAVNPSLGLSAGGDDIEICDARIYDRYVPADELRGLLSVRAESGDLGLVGYWPFTDNSGGTINDEGSGSNDGTVAGVLNTDYSWQPSDLGEPELAGRPMPIVVGEVLNAPAHLIDTARERYRLEGGALGDVYTNATVTVRSQGTALTGGGTDYTPPASSTADGVLVMTAAEDEPVTWSLVNSVNKVISYPGQVAYDLLTERTRLTSADVNSARAAELGALLPWRCGYWTDGDATAQFALMEILGQTGLAYREDAAGDLYFDYLLPPVAYGPYGEPVWDFGGDADADMEFGDIADAAGSLTLAGWVYTPVHDGGATAGSFWLNVAGKADGVGGNYGLWLQNSGTPYTYLAFQVRGAGTLLTSPVNAIQPGAWYFVAGVFDDAGNTLKMYGAPLGSTLVEIASGSESGSPTVNAQALTIGMGSALGTRYPWGSVQHAQVWTTTKSLADLQALMATPPVGNEANLAAYVPLNEGTGTPVEKVTSTSATVTSTRWAPKLQVNLAQTPSVRLHEFRRAAPAAEVLVRYARNRRPLSDAEIDAGVSQSDRLDLRREWKEAWLDNADNRTRYKSARKLVLDSPLTDRESAQRLARSLMTRFGTDRYLATLEFPPGLAVSRMACGLALGDEVGLTASIPSQLASGRSMRVVGVAHNPLSLSTRLTLWG